MQKGQILKRVTNLLKPYARGALILTLLTLLGVAAELLPPKLQQYMVDDILSEKAQAQGAGAAVAFADFRTALLVVGLALGFSRVILSAGGRVKGRLGIRIGRGRAGTPLSPVRVGASGSCHNLSRLFLRPPLPNPDGPGGTRKPRTGRIAGGDTRSRQAFDPRL